MKPRIVVQDGPIVVNNIYAVAKHADVMVFRADLKAKYAAVCGGGEHSIDLGADDDTLYAKKSDRAYTTVEFQGLTEDWHVEAMMTGRYTVTFLLLRQVREPRMVWP